MVYKKLTIFTVIISIVAAFTCNFVFATIPNKLLCDSIISFIHISFIHKLIFLQKYSWPIITLVFVYALYKFYVMGSEYVEQKLIGQRMIIGISIFMVLIQCLPLAYAFVIVNT